MVPAGHILGAASVVIEDEKEGKVVVFSGDLGTGESPLIGDPQAPERADLVVMESTYGNRLHEEVNEEEALEREMRKVMKMKGALLVPTFSIQRTQRVLYRLGSLSRQGRIPRGMTVYLDSPMAIRATRVFRKNAELYSGELKKKMKGRDPFSFPELKITEKGWESKKIAKDPGDQDDCGWEWNDDWRKDYWVMQRSIWEETQQLCCLWGIRQRIAWGERCRKERKV